MKRSLLSITAGAVLALVTVGCSGNSDPDDLNPRAPTTVEVANYNSSTVSIDLMSDGRDYPLGEVSSGESESFEIPRVVDPLHVQVLVDPIGSTENYLSPEVRPSAGDVVEVDVGARVGDTTVRVRR